MHGETVTYTKLVLLVDDEELTLKSAKLCLKGSGISNIATLADSRGVLSFLEANQVAVILLDLNMPNLTGLQLLPRIVERYPHIPVIMMTASDEIANVVECMKSGAFDYLVKPVESSRLVASVQKALELCDISNELSTLKQRFLADRLENPAAFADIVTNNRKMRALFQYVEVVAPTRQPIMITGETGTGKELLARAIHALSGCRGELVAVNVAGLDDNMFADALFGHTKGAFTGAEKPREGFIGRAAGGTLFLDEIGDLSELSQIKLLRLMQEKEYYPVGSDILRKSDARIVLATNRDLGGLVAAGKFRNDLYYRLRAHQVHIPPLRERADDIPLLAEHFLADGAILFRKQKPAVPPEVMTQLSSYQFAGNVRELEAMMNDAVARNQGEPLAIENLNGSQSHAAVVEAPQGQFVGGSFLAAVFGGFPTMEKMEDYLIAEALKQSRGNQGLAAQLLGISRQTLNRRLNVNREP
jgi:DNA-binding NtrC family response regulator